MDELAAAAGGLAQLTFVIDESTRVGASWIRLAAGFGEVLGAAGLTAEQLAPQLSECHGVVTFADSRLRLAAEVAQRLGWPQHSPECAATLTDKPRQRHALAAAGLPTPRWIELRAGTTAEEALAQSAELPFPAVLKPCRGTASRCTWLIEDNDALANRIESLAQHALPEDFILEQLWIGVSQPAPLGDYVSVEIASAGGQHTVIGISARMPLQHPFREAGMIVPGLLAEPERTEAVGVARAALDALGVRWGVSHTELKLTAAGPRVIEVNGRLGGHVDVLYEHSGIARVARNALQCALGQKPDPPLPARRPAASLMLPMPATGSPDRRALLALAAALRDWDGVWRVETPLPGPGGQRIEDGTMSAPLTVWLEVGGDDLAAAVAEVVALARPVFGADLVMVPTR
jgi:biotin carboxylase